MPYSPNVTLVPPLAAPDRLGWCCLRCLTLRGMSTTSALPVPCFGRGAFRPRGVLGCARRRLRLLGGGGRGTAGLRAGRRGPGRAGPTRTGGPVRAVGPLAARRATAIGRRVPLPAGADAADDLTLVDPHLHADPA